MLLSMGIFYVNLSIFNLSWLSPLISIAIFMTGNGSTQNKQQLVLEKLGAKNFMTHNFSNI